MSFIEARSGQQRASQSPRPLPFTSIIGTRAGALLTAFSSLRRDIMWEWSLMPNVVDGDEVNAGNRMLDQQRQSEVRVFCVSVVKRESHGRFLASAFADAMLYLVESD